jgi:hypothetical protein
VALPEHPGKHRLLHIHRNQPGVLSAINSLFSERRINIAGQYLQTDARIGYVVIDVETGPPRGGAGAQARAGRGAGDHSHAGAVLRELRDSIATG